MSKSSKISCCNNNLTTLWPKDTTLLSYITLYRIGTINFINLILFSKIHLKFGRIFNKSCDIELLL